MITVDRFRVRRRYGYTIRLVVLLSLSLWLANTTACNNDGWVLGQQDDMSMAIGSASAVADPCTTQWQCCSPDEPCDCDGQRYCVCWDGTCDLRCLAGSSCDFSCTEDCSVICEPDSVCAIGCGSDCEVLCQAGASCSLSSPDGLSQMQCELDGHCQCSAAEGCVCTGPGCVDYQ